MAISVHTAQPGEPVASVMETPPTWTQATHSLTSSLIIITSVAQTYHLPLLTLASQPL